MRKPTVFLLLLALLLSAAGAESPAGTESFVYGTSTLGRELECVRVGDAGAPVRFLMVFCVHGYEDRFVRDGALLTETARALIAALSAPGALPAGCAVYVVPCANPDGLLEGTSNTGFGRCNAEGLDINRDFPEGWVKRTGAANRTGEAPYATAEARALRDLVSSVSPAWAADVHGYVNVVKYASHREMARFFAAGDVMDTEYEKWQSGGMLCTWLDTVTEGALLIELPSPLRGGNVNELKEDYAVDMAGRLLRGVTGWLERVTAGE